MWKFGIVSTGLFRCCSVNMAISQRFASLDKKEKKYPKKTRKFPGKRIANERPATSIGRQPAALDRHDEFFEEDDFDNEVDVLKFDKLYDDHKKFGEERKEMVKMKIVEQKYFRAPQENKLSWSDKEHIRYLHNTDPQTWTFKMISDHFSVNENTARKIASATWIPKKNTKLKEEDNQVSETQVAEFVKLRDPDACRSKSRDRQEIMTLEELHKSMGMEPKREEINHKLEAEPIHNLKNDTEADKLIQFLSKDRPCVWAEKREPYPNLKIDSYKNTNSQNVYYYDKKYGYQHPYGKASDEDSNNRAPTTKAGDVYRRGDCFYDEDGEFLYRVPGLVSN